jgi:hypothetical protein
VLVVSRRTGAVQTLGAGDTFYGLALRGDRVFTTRTVGSQGLALVALDLQGGEEVLDAYGTLAPASIAADADGVFAATSAGLASRP